MKFDFEIHLNYGIVGITKFYKYDIDFNEVVSYILANKNNKDLIFCVWEHDTNNYTEIKTEEDYNNFVIKYMGVINNEI